VYAQTVAKFQNAIELAGTRARAAGRPILAWTTVRVPVLDPIELFARGTALFGGRTLFTRPEDAFGLVGLGSAWTCSADGEDRFTAAGTAWRAMLEDAVGEDGPLPWGAGPVVLGGFPFADGGPPDPDWNRYARGTLVLPRSAVLSTADATWVTLAAVVDPGADGNSTADEVDTWISAVGDLLGSETALDSIGSTASELTMLDEFPQAQVWKAAVEEAARAVRGGELSKVVLARGIRVGARRLDPARALRRLRAGYPGCTLFAVSHGDRCFLGATPERLVRVRGGMFHTAAVAGSAPRGATAEDDARLGARLLAGRKDRLEHSLVVEAIRDALSGIWETPPSTPEPALLKVRNVQHLYTPYEGVMRQPHTVLELVDRLHPTPAVGGVPRDAALRWIRRHEGWDRGWYAGPVLWMDRAGEGESAVAIRSALLGNTEGRLFAGCGIMGDSDPDEEYAESMLKCRAMLSALNGASGHEHV